MSVASREVVQQRVRRAITLAFVGDALAMPVHWFYDTKDIRNAFGDAGIQKMEAPPAKHPYTFMKAPEPVERAKGKRIVGDVILPQTAKNWGPDNQHVHVSLKAGENTLNAEVASEVVLELLAEQKTPFDVDAYVAAYVKFLTANPQLPKDTYAEGFHRNFFTEYAAGADPRFNCADTSEGAESVGGWTTVVPVIIVELARDGNVERVQRLAKDHVARTHKRERLVELTGLLVELIAKLLFRTDDAAVPPALAAAYEDAKPVIPSALLDLIKQADGDVIGIDGQPIPSSCDVKNSWPALMFLTLKYAGQVSEGILANVNVGGENCHRGFVAGSLLSLTSDESAEQAVNRFAPTLANRAALNARLDAILKHITPAA